MPPSTALAVREPSEPLPPKEIAKPKPLRFDYAINSRNHRIVMLTTSRDSHLRVYTKTSMRRHTDNDEVTAVGYLRVSTERQGEYGIGLAAQEAQIRAFGKSMGIRITHVFSDVASATSIGSIRRRSGLQKALAAARRLGCPIVVSSADRISRNSVDFDSLTERDRRRFIDASADGSADRIASIMGQIARGEFEAAALSKRTREKLQEKKAAGAILGNRTNLPVAQKLGAAVNKALALERDNALERELAPFRSRGITSVGDLVDALNDVGSTAPRGGPWTVPSLRRPLRRILEREASAAAPDGLGEVNDRGPSAADLCNPMWGRF